MKQTYPGNPDSDRCKSDICRGDYVRVEKGVNKGDMWDIYGIYIGQTGDKPRRAPKKSLPGGRLL